VRTCLRTSRLRTCWLERKKVRSEWATVLWPLGRED
jgi:hypothetical protein